MDLIPPSRGREALLQRLLLSEVKGQETLLEHTWYTHAVPTNMRSDFRIAAGANGGSTPLLARVRMTEKQCKQSIRLSGRGIVWNLFILLFM